MLEETSVPKRGWSIKWLVALGLAFLLVIYFIIAYNAMARLEADIPAFQTKSKNSLSTLVNSAKSQGIIQAQYEDAFMRALDKTFKGRYGDTGIKAFMVAVKEENIPLSTEMLQQLQVNLEGGYRKFEADQNAVVDACKLLRYKTSTLPSSLVAGLCGFPRLKLEDYENIVLNQDAAEAFETKRMGPIDVRPDPKLQPEKQ